MRRLRALVFDDDDGLRELLTLLLQARGYEVFSYAEPIHCPVYDLLDCACGSGFVCADIVVTDLQMPRVSGLDLVEQQRTRHCRIDADNVAVMSAGWTPEDLDRAEELDCRVFHKPFALAEFRAWLDACDKRARLMDRLRDLEVGMGADREPVQGESGD